MNDKLNAPLLDEQGQIALHDIESSIVRLGLEQAHISPYLKGQLYSLVVSGSVCASQVLEPLAAAFNGDGSSTYRAVEWFNRNPTLSGLGKFHWSDSSLKNMAMNLKASVRSLNESDFDFDETPKTISEVLNSKLKERSDNKSMTGEYVIIDEDQSQNLRFLCLSTHSEASGSTPASVQNLMSKVAEAKSSFN